ncbi:FAD:protein FMN transferase [Massilia sp. METH4]|uniref:FAD:protein FMN transferase n=1 Tax=Massilia sp. METH4 TaxID=3123041 RepID=UPI0030D0C3B7
MFHHTFAAMNTRFSMVLPETEARAGRRFAREAEAVLVEQERMMSRFVAHGDLATVNRDAAGGPVPVPDGLWDVLQTCRRHHELTDGAFDIAQGSQRGGHRMQMVHFDPVARTLQFTAPGMQLDLGGIGKGIALDRVRQLLLDRGVGHAFLSFGESSVGVIGTHPAGDCWPVGVEDLFEPGRSLHRFDLRDSSMSTSGNREGQAHIVDPSSGCLVTGCETMTVACASATDAEVLSTALLVVPAPRRAAILRHYAGVQAVHIVYRKSNGRWTGEKDWLYE